MNTSEKFRIMIQLALVDNQFEETEKQFITDLAKLHQVSTEKLDSIIQEELSKKESDPKINSDLTFDSKIEILADMVRIMKADGKVYLSEIKFCEMIAKMFGFQEKSIGLLSGMIHKDPTVPTNWDKVQDKMKKLVV